MTISRPRGCAPVTIHGIEVAPGGSITFRSVDRRERPEDPPRLAWEVQPRLAFATTAETPRDFPAPTVERFIVRSAEGYYAGPIGRHTPDVVAPPRWVADPRQAWAYGSRDGALEVIRGRGWPCGVAEVVPAPPPEIPGGDAPISFGYVEAANPRSRPESIGRRLARGLARRAAGILHEMSTEPPTLIVVENGHTAEVHLDESMTVEHVNAALAARGLSSVRAVDPGEADELCRNYEAQRRASLLESLGVEEPGDVAGARALLGLGSGPLEALATKDLESIRSMLEPDSY